MNIIIPAVIASVTFILGFILHKILVAKEIRGAEVEADRIVSDAKRESETIKREALLEGRDIISRERVDSLEKFQERRANLDRKENQAASETERLGILRERLQETKKTIDKR